MHDFSNCDSPSRCFVTVFFVFFWDWVTSMDDKHEQNHADNKVSIDCDHINKG